MLRVQRIVYHTSTEIRSELAWIESLITEDIVVTPRPVADGEGRLLSQIVLNGSPRYRRTIFRILQAFPQRKTQFVIGGE
ncbi:hypothetical protein [Bradyrhizobium sp. DOA9]|uniref:hypothetical protein n=1 Tax=Bradyrhizobium sp. DOA9 TaxID=1126627 RepID=UPI000468E925|nr:hypothetical protein [Bradyrhizobium sp. DOA9]